jgi:opacity protein-like surface antigen
VKVTGRYLFASAWALDLSYTYQDWQAEDGVDRTFFANGSVTEQKLNEVNWKSTAVTAGVSYKFY